MWFPADSEIWVNLWDAEKETDFVKFTYEVENDVVTLSDPEDVVLTVAPRVINVEVASLNTKLGETQEQLDIKNEAVISASKKINDLKVEISELTPYKEQVEKAEAERIEAEIAQAKEQLRNDMLKGGLFTAEEIEKPEIAELIEARNESAIKGLIADKYLASLDVQAGNEVAEVQTEDVETASANLNANDVEEDIDPKSIMHRVLYGNKNVF
jgi:cell division protein FtsL